MPRMSFVFHSPLAATFLGAKFIDFFFPRDPSVLPSFSLSLSLSLSLFLSLPPSLPPSPSPSVSFVINHASKNARPDVLSRSLRHLQFIFSHFSNLSRFKISISVGWRYSGHDIWWNRRRRAPRLRTTFNLQAACTQRPRRFPAPLRSKTECCDNAKALCREGQDLHENAKPRSPLPAVCNVQ